MKNKHFKVLGLSCIILNTICGLLGMISGVEHYSTHFLIALALSIPLIVEY